MGLRYAMVGQVFGRLTVISRAPNAKGNQTQWHCRCVCGFEGVFSGSHMRQGVTQSCGCLRAECTSRRRKTHGQTTTPLYRVWRAMLDRCHLKSHKSYRFYGGRGVVVCAEWRASFECFAGDMAATYRKGLWLDRREVNGMYCRDNCRWVTPKQQQRNRRDNVLLEYAGQVRTLAEIVEMCGVQYGLVRSRLSRGWPLLDAIHKPVGTWLKHKQRLSQ